MVLVKEGQETRSDKLWIPTNTQAQEDKVYVDKHYGKEFRFENFIFKVKNKEGAPRLCPRLAATGAERLAALSARPWMTPTGCEHCANGLTGADAAVQEACWFPRPSIKCWMCIIT
jgi:hypothetical protein